MDESSHRERERDFILGARSSMSKSLMIETKNFFDLQCEVAAEVESRLNSPFEGPGRAEQ